MTPIIAILLIVCGLTVSLSIWLAATRQGILRERDGLVAENQQLRTAGDVLQQQLQADRQQIAALQTHIARCEEREVASEKAFKTACEQLDGVFKNTAGEALEKTNAQFIQLAEQKLKPIVELFNRYDQQYKVIEQARKQEYGGLSKTADQLLTQTHALISALRRPEVRGKWGEIALRRIVELAGLTNRCDFDEQINLNTPEGRLRPDMIVTLPNARCIAIDSKITLDAFSEAVRLPEGEERTVLLQRHVMQINEQVTRLHSKSYARHMERSPDFVVLFMQVESALYGALDVDATVIERALERKVVIATPTLLIALLKAVEIGWHEYTIAENASQLRDLGQELHERLAKTLGDVVKLGGSIESTVKHYNAMVGSLDARVMPSARKFEQAGARSARELPGQLEQVTLIPRELRSLTQVSDE